MTDNSLVEYAVLERYTSQKQKGHLKYAIVEVTSRCQLLCPGCYMITGGNINKGASLSLEQAVEILDRCKAYTGHELESVDILGGEPLLWPELKAFIEILIARGIRPWVFTNMLMVTDELAQWLFDRQVAITGKLNIDPRDPDQYALQAKMLGARDVTVRKLLKSIEIFQRAGYKKPLFRLQNLIRKDNIEYVPAYYDYCLSHDLGTDLELMASGEGVCEEYWKIAPTPQQIADMVRRIQTVRKQHGLAEKKVLMPHVFGACPFFDSGMYFASNGDIRACSNSPHVLAHISHPDCIRQAYESELFCNRLQLDQSKVKEPCNTCDRWSECRGGCRATAEADGDPFAGYALCPVPYL